MRLLAAIDGAPGRAERGKGKRVRRRAGGDRKDLHRRLEDLAETALQQGGPLVAAIAGRGALIGGGQRGDDLGRRTPCVVAAEIDDRRGGTMIGHVAGIQSVGSVRTVASPSPLPQVARLPHTTRITLRSLCHENRRTSGPPA